MWMTPPGGVQRSLHNIHDSLEICVLFETVSFFSSLKEDSMFLLSTSGAILGKRYILRVLCLFL